MLASAALGGFGVQELRAQAKPPVYFIGEIDVTNPDGYAKEYLPKAREIIKAHGGHGTLRGYRRKTGAPLWRRRRLYWRPDQARQNGLSSS